MKTIGLFVVPLDVLFSKEFQDSYLGCIQKQGVFRKIGSHLIATAVFCILLYQSIIRLIYC